MSLTNTIDQEALWRGAFGDEYTERNRRRPASELAFFARALARTQGIRSVVEFGAGEGVNLAAIAALMPGVQLAGVEINDSAFETLVKLAPGSLHGSIFDYAPMPAELALTKGLLIHLPPERRQAAYHRIMQSTTRYVLLAEYYNPTPLMVPYRGNANAMWKADFAGEMLDKYPSLRLLDYGFQYHRDPNWPQDDINWFLMEKAR